MVKPSPVLDGLRGIASLVVLLIHCLVGIEAEHRLPHAGLAVDFFFMLSGYCVTAYYLDYLKTRSSAIGFFKTRLIAFYPMIALGLAMGIAVYLMRTVLVPDPVSWSAFAINVVLSALLIPSPVPVSDTWVFVYAFNGVTWSIAFELAIILFFGLVFSRLTKGVLLAFVGIGAAAVVYQCYRYGVVTGGMNWNHIGDHATYYNATIAGLTIPLPVFVPMGLTRAFFPFFCGLLVYRIQQRQVAQAPTSGPLACIALAVALLITAPMPRWIYETMTVLIVFPLIIYVAGGARPGARATALYEWMGKIAYPLYLTHYPIVIVFSFMMRKAPGQIPLWVWMAVEIVACLAFSHIVVKLYEGRARAWLTRKLHSVRDATAVNQVAP